MAVFRSAPMTTLVDEAVRYDLAESTCPPLVLADLLDDETTERLRGWSLGYGTSPGDQELRELIAASTAVSPDNVLVTGGAISAMFLLALVQCAPGDHVVLATPCFPPAFSVPEGLGARMSLVPLDFAAGYRVDVAAVRAALTPQTKLLSLASPQNPSGVSLDEADLNDVIAVVDEVSPEAIVFVDETYRETGYGDAPIPRSAAGLSPRVVTTSSLSKSHGAPDLRIGWLTSTDPGLVERLRVAKFNSAISCSGVTEQLACAVLRHGPEILRVRSELLATTLGIFEHWASSHAGLVDYVRPDGGALLCMRLSEASFDDTAVARFYSALPGSDVRVAPGSWFGTEDRVCRIGFGHLPLEDFEEALARLGEALESVAASPSPARHPEVS